MSHVLEHMINLEDFLEQIKNNLDDDGIFFIEVPNAEHKLTLDASINKNPHVYHFSKIALSKDFTPPRIFLILILSISPQFIINI